MEFRYIAYTKAGKKREGTLEAKTTEAAAEALHSKGWTVISVAEASALGLDRFLALNIGGVPLKEKVLFFRQMAYMLGAGLPLVNGLEVLSKQAKNKAFKKVMKVVVSDVRAGAQLNTAMRKHREIFDKITVNLIRAGEESGKLEEVFERLAADFEKRQEFTGKVRGAMIYPAIIMIMVVAVVAVLLIFMVPAVEELFGEFDAELPFATAMMISLSNALRGFWGIFGLFMCAALALFYRYYRSTKEGKKVTDGLILKVPIFGELTRKTVLARFARTFSMLLTSGVEILDAINLTSESLNNEVYSEALKQASIAVEKGGSLAKVIARSEVFPPIVAEMIAVGEKTGKLDEIVDKMGDYFEREADQMASNLTKTMEPAIMVVVGFIVGFIALSIYTPIFKLGNVIK